MEQTKQAQVSVGEIERAILGAIEALNRSRLPDQQLDVAPDAALFGNGSRLDSLGLVSLLIEIEDHLASRGWSITLSDERAMSQKRSPFRDVPALVTYIEGLLAQAS